MLRRRARKSTERSAEVDTRTRILDAAERLVAERGFHGVSLREITAAAGANSAAVHYYFRHKEDLLEASSTVGPELWFRSGSSACNRCSRARNYRHLRR